MWNLLLPSSRWFGSRCYDLESCLYNSLHSTGTHWCISEWGPASESVFCTQAGKHLKTFNYQPKRTCLFCCWQVCTETGHEASLSGVPGGWHEPGHQHLHQGQDGSCLHVRWPHKGVSLPWPGPEWGSHKEPPDWNLLQKYKRDKQLTIIRMLNPKILVLLPRHQDHTSCTLTVS